MDNVRQFPTSETIIIKRLQEASAEMAKKFQLDSMPDWDAIGALDPTSKYELLSNVSFALENIIEACQKLKSVVDNCREII